ncbi:MAG TPA: HAMP domain-containing sensor histidine kinase [Bacteroidales bacterium]|nr:HAMP domain-containing sensor histidine kinase [Bacteroidales bacterium]
MRRHLLLILSLIALMLFMAVQIYMINSIWKQQEEILLMRYKTLSREGLSLLLLKKKANGFEKAMDISDKFTGLVTTEKLPVLNSSDDTAGFRKKVLEQTYSIIEKNEALSSFLRSYIKKAGYENDFKTEVFISYFSLLTYDGPLEIARITPPDIPGTMVLVNSFMQEHNNFVIDYSFLINLTNKKEMVFREAFLSLALITGSILIVIMVFVITWRNLMEEKRLSDLKTDFINNMTHELKTPLSTITVAGRTLEKEQILNDPTRILETAHLIGKQSIHLNQLINTILEVSLLERSEFELTRQEVNVDELTHQIVASFLTSCDGCAVIKEEYNTGGVIVSLDLLYYTTMVNNLLANAVKYCASEPVIWITTSSEDKNVAVTVADNGVGIAREHLDHIFEKFYRITEGNIHKTKGLGLGLYYVNRIANAHGGEVTVNSKPGKGTTFKIRIPL